MKKRNLLSVAVLLGLMVGCSNEATEPDNSSNESNQVEASDEFVLKHTSDLVSAGYEDIVLEEQPEKIALLITNPFNILYEMGVDLAVVPESKSVIYPEDLNAEVLPGVMSSTFDLEAIVDLEPDLVFFPESSMETHGQTLKDAGINVYAVSMSDLNGEKNSYEYIKEQAEVIIDAFATTDEAKAGAQVIEEKFEDVEARIAAYKSANNSQTYLSTMAAGETDLYIQTPSSVLGGILDMLGFENKYEEIAQTDQEAGHGSAPANLESLVGIETDHYFFITQAGTPEDAKVIIDGVIANNPTVWDTIPAVERGDYSVLTSKYFVTGGLTIVDTINELLDHLESLN